MKFRNLLKLFMTVYAAGEYTPEVVVATSTGATNASTPLFTEAIRTVYSKEIEFKALPIMRFFQFATIKTELGVEPGLTISMLTYDNLTLGGALEEAKNMTTQALSGQAKSITVQEYGNAVSATELAIRASFLNIMADATTLLGRDYAMVLDGELRDAALDNDTNIVYASNEETPVTQRTDLVAACTMKVSTIKDAIEILSTSNAPMYQGTSWVCFIHPHQERSLRDDPAWINASNYGAPTQLFTGEVGKIDNTRFVVTTLMCNGAAASTEPGYKAELVSGTAGNQTAVYQAVLFGDQYFGVAFALPVEMRDNGVEDFGRKRSIAWYAIFGVGLLNENYGVLIETA